MKHVNHIIPVVNPDPSFCPVAENYYLVTSSLYIDRKKIKRLQKNEFFYFLRKRCKSLSITRGRIWNPPLQVNSAFHGNCYAISGAEFTGMRSFFH